MSEPTHMSIDLEKELAQERELRSRTEARLKELERELLVKDSDLSKYKHMPGKIQHYKNKAARTKKDRNILLVISFVLLLISGFFVFERLQKAKEFEAMKAQFEKAKIEKKKTPGVFKQDELNHGHVYDDEVGDDSPQYDF